MIGETRGSKTEELYAATSDTKHAIKNLSQRGHSYKCILKEQWCRKPAEKVEWRQIPGQDDHAIKPDLQGER